MCAKSRFFTKNEEKFKKNNAKGLFSCATCGKTVKKYLETFVFFKTENRFMNYGSICSGVEAATLAWKPSDTGFRISREV